MAYRESSEGGFDLSVWALRFILIVLMLVFSALS